VWFDVDALWGAEPAFALPGAIDLPRFGPSETGLDASRRRRQAAKDLRRRRLQTRTVPAVAVVIGSSAVLPVAALRMRAATGDPLPLLEDPPSLTLTPAVVLTPQRTIKAQVEQVESPRIEWRNALSEGLPYAGHLHGATQLPVESADWVTWHPGTDSRPNHPSRLYGHERTIRRIVDVVTAYRASHPKAPRVVIGDISFRGGGPMDQHVSHQNGLDVDVYYPRRDGRLRAPTSTAQVDRRLSQILLDAFLDAGAKIVFVGYTTDLRGPGGVVVPYPNHENHMHVRFANPG
jgi:hypothetical protein